MVMQNMRTRLIVGIALVVVGVAGLVIIGGRWDHHGDTWGGHMLRGPGMGLGPQGRVQPEISGARSIQIEATDTALTPDRITAKVGEAVNITLANRGSTVFHLAIPAQGVWLVAAPGQSVTTGFKSDAAGEYAFFGGVRGRRGAHVIGRITVVP